MKIVRYVVTTGFWAGAIASGTIAKAAGMHDAQAVNLMSGAITLVALVTGIIALTVAERKYARY